MKRKSEKITEQTEQPKIVVLYGDDGGDNHEPPIGVGGDSVYIDLPYDLLRSEMLLEYDLEEDAPRYYKYKFARDEKAKPYFNLDAVRVLTEKGDCSGYVTCLEHKIPKDKISRLRLWLGDATGEPEIIIGGKNGGSILSAQPLVEELRAANPPKRNRVKRYYFPVRDVRVVRWDIVDENNTILTDPAMENGTLAADGDDQYYFYVSFAHELPAAESA